MSVQTEGPHNWEVVLSLSPGRQSVDNAHILVPAETTLRAGTIVGRVASPPSELADRKVYEPYDDGDHEEAAVLPAEVKNTGTVEAALSGVVVNWGAEVRIAKLIWGEGVDQDAGLAALEKKGVKAR
jgi:hypothetical protein